MATPPAKPSRGRGHIRQRGNSIQVLVYAGVDPVTGKPSYLSESVHVGTGKNAQRVAEREADKVLTRLLAQRDAAQVAKTSATLTRAIEEWLAVADLEVSTRQGYRSYIDRYIQPALGDTPVKRIQVQTLDKYYAELRRCRTRCRGGRPTIEHRVDGPHECREVRHRRKRDHDCAAVGCRVLECLPHQCRPLSASTVLQIHSIISGALSNAVSWDWIPTNPAERARKPAAPTPDPRPPTRTDADRLTEAAFAEDEEWGTLIYLKKVTGMRRGEIAALEWPEVDEDDATLRIDKSYFARQGEKILKETKTHQVRVVALDDFAVTKLRALRAHRTATLAKLGITSLAGIKVFSPAADGRRPWHPDSISRRFNRMTKRLGIKANLKMLRHYNATQLMAGGVDPRTVAGRLGHAGGGATTLRVYTAFVDESNRRAATIIAGQAPQVQLPSST